MDSNIKLSNVIGAPFTDYVLQQLAIRANRNTRLKRDIEDVLFLANKSAWARLVSSVNINGNQEEITKFYGNLGTSQTNDYDPQGLARNWILEAGTSIQDGNGIDLRKGIGVGDYAYGLGGTRELGYRPMPGLTSIQVETLGRLGSLRQATISFKVWNINQLNVVEALYFRLGYSMLLEWGHTQYFSNIDTTRGEFKPEGIFVSKEIYGIGDPFAEGRRKLEIQQEIARKARDTSGNYDGMLGIVSNFNWAFNQEGGYDCTVRIIGPGAIMNTVRVNQLYQLPDGDIKRYLRNKEILDRRLKEIEAKQKALDAALQEVRDAGPGGATTTTRPLPKAPTNFEELKKLLIQYDGADPTKDIVSDPAYQVTGYDFISVGGGSPSPIKVNQVYAEFNTSGRTTPGIGPDERLQIQGAYSGLYPSYGGAAFGNIKPGLPNSVPNTYLSPQLFSKFGNAVLSNNNVYPFGDTPSNYEERSRQALTAAGVTVNNGGVYQIAQQLVFDEGIASSERLQTNYQIVEQKDLNTDLNIVKFNGERRGQVRDFSFKTPLPDGGDLYFDGKITVSEINQGTSAAYPLTRKLIIQALDTYITTGNGGRGFYANIQTLTRSGTGVVVKGNIILGSASNPILAPYVGSDPTLAGQQRGYIITVSYTTNNFLLFSPYVAPPSTVAKRDAESAAGDTGTKNTVNDAAKERSDGFQSALHAMLTIVQAEVQANANRTAPVAYLSINEKGGERYRTAIQNFFSKGILNGIIGYDADNPPPNSNPDLKYAVKGFNANLMLDPTLYDQIPTVDFDILTRAFIVRIDQDTTDNFKDTVRCPVYISMGFLLAFLSNMCIVYDSTRPLRDIASNGSNDQRPYFYIDFNPETNLSLTFPQQFSVDPFICLMPFSATKEEYLDIFPSSIPSGSIAFDPTKNNVLRTSLEKANYSFQGTTNSNQGRIMKTLLNVEYLLNLLSEFQYSDPEHAVNLQPFLERILVDIGKCTGNANYYKLVYRDDANTLQIIDYQVTPKLQGEKTMTDKDAYNQARKSSQLQSRILSGELPVFGSGSIAREFQLKTTISTSLAKMIAISASPVTASINATEHSSFSTLNELYVDRYKPYPGDAGTILPAANTNTRQGTAVSNDVKAATLFDQHVSQVNSNFQVSKDNIELAKNYYIERISKVKAGFPTTAAAAPIPANAEITIDGISGIVMYNAFTIPEERLPISLRGINGETRFGFIVSGLTHVIENNQWLTKLTGQMFPLRKAGSLGRISLFAEGEQRAIPGTNVGGTTPGRSSSRVPRGTDLFRNSGAAPTSNYLLGRARRIPDNPAHANWGGLAEIWQNNNAWDLGASAGTPVYAIVDGTVSNVLFNENFDTVWGYSLTLKGSASSFFYTHLDSVLVPGGTVVSRGTLLGYIGQFPDDYARLRSYSHLHIGVQAGKLRNYVDQDGKFI